MKKFGITALVAAFSWGTAHAQSLALGFDRGGSFGLTSLALTSKPFGGGWSIESGPFASSRLANGQTGVGYELDLKKTLGPAYGFLGAGFCQWNNAKPEGVLLLGIGLKL